jgi:hypothetical protein
MDHLVHLCHGNTNYTPVDPPWRIGRVVRKLELDEVGLRSGGG